MRTMMKILASSSTNNVLVCWGETERKELVFEAYSLVRCFESIRGALGHVVLFDAWYTKHSGAERKPVVCSISMLEFVPRR